jgi:YD repeat-containing protein
MNPIRLAKSWINYRRTMNELGNLSAQTLNDIGLTRYDIRSVASRAFR